MAACSRNLSAAMSKLHIFPCIRIVLVCALLGTSIGVGAQIMRLTSRPPEFRSLAKVTAQLADDKTARLSNTVLKDFENKILNLLVSDALKVHALKRVQALHPELKSMEVEIRVAAPNDTVIPILATARAPEYAKIFLDALLDEFISAWVQLKEEEFEINHSRLLDELTLSQRQVEAAETQLAEVRNQSRVPAETDLSPASTRIKPSDMVEQAEIASRRAVAARSSAYARLEQARSAFKSRTDYIAVLERATPASENIEDWTLPIVVGVIGGGFLGAMLGLPLSFISARPTSA